MASDQPATRGRGRPAAASRDEVLRAGLHRYLRGRRVDVQAIAAELGLGRATVYRWFGSREKLIGEVVIAATEPVLAKARAESRKRGGAGLLDTFDRFNRALADAPALLSFLEQERDAALRIIASGGGVVQPRVVELITALIEEEVEAGRYDPPVEPAVLGFAIVKLAQAFLFNDAVAGMRGDVDRLREVEAALLGVEP
jgi:AcrR family transcriptional regulator